MLNNKPRHRLSTRLAAAVVAASLAALAAAQEDATVPGDEAEDVQASRATAAKDMPSAEVLAAARNDYVNAIRGGLYSEAADATKLYISEYLKNPDFDRYEWGLALAQLGDAQHRAGNLASAIENYDLAVETLQESADHLSPSLVEPLTGLGTAYFEAGEYRNATGTFERAIHVQQVNEGLNSLAIGVTLDALAEAYFRMGDFDRARAAEQSYVSLYSQNYDGDDLRKLPALYSQAQMLHRTGWDYDAQKAYFRIVSLIEHAEGSGSLELLPAIYELAALMQVDTVIDGIDGNYRARRFLRRAIHIAENHPDASPIEIADAYIQMGDFMATNTADRRTALRRYSTAWDLLSADENLEEARHARFGTPTLLNEVPRTTVPIMRKLLITSINADDQLDPRLLIRYDVDDTGEPRNIDMIEADPTGHLDPIVIRHVGKFVFRPAYVDGEPIEVPNQVYEIRYSHSIAAELRDW